jgi:hypothetical protein
VETAFLEGRGYNLRPLASGPTAVDDVTVSARGRPRGSGVLPGEQPEGS